MCMWVDTLYKLLTNVLVKPTAVRDILGRFLGDGGVAVGYHDA